MNSRSENHSFVNTITFKLIDKTQYEKSLIDTSNAIKDLSPAIGYVFAQHLNTVPQKIHVSFLNHKPEQVFGCEFKIDVISNTELKIENYNNILQALAQSLEKVDSHKLFNFSVSNLNISSITNANTSAKFRGKVAKRIFDYNQVDELIETQIDFLDENELSVGPIAYKREFKWDAFNNITGITYHYQIYDGLSSELQSELEFEVKAYIENHSEYRSFYKSVQSKDYNQAFRRACSVGSYSLVLLLLDFGSKKGSLNLDFNQSSTNGMTSLDYALASGNQDLIKLLKINGAKTSQDLALALVDHERNTIMQDYKAKQKKSSGFSSSFSHLSLNPEPPKENSFDRVMRMNEENRRQLENQRISNSTNSFFQAPSVGFSAAQRFFGQPNFSAINQFGQSNSSDSFNLNQNLNSQFSSPFDNLGRPFNQSGQSQHSFNRKSPFGVN